MVVEDFPVRKRKLRTGQLLLIAVTAILVGVQLGALVVAVWGMVR